MFKRKVLMLLIVSVVSINLAGCNMRLFGLGENNKESQEVVEAETTTLDESEETMAVPATSGSATVSKYKPQGVGDLTVVDTGKSEDEVDSNKETEVAGESMEAKSVDEVKQEIDESSLPDGVAPELDSVEGVKANIVKQVVVDGNGSASNDNPTTMKNTIAKVTTDIDAWGVIAATYCVHQRMREFDSAIERVSDYITDDLKAKCIELNKVFSDDNLEYTDHDVFYSITSTKLYEVELRITIMEQQFDVTIEVNDDGKVKAVRCSDDYSARH